MYSASFQLGIFFIFKLGTVELSYVEVIIFQRNQGSSYIVSSLNMEKKKIWNSLTFFTHFSFLQK